MKVRKFFVIFFLLIPFLFGYAQQEDLLLNNYWLYNGSTNNALYEHIISKSFIQIEERWAHINELKTKNDWINRQTEARKIMGNIVGNFPEKTPLNPVITGTIKRDGFTIEKLYFESRPGFYVSSALFLPAKRKKMPAIIYCSGHSADGFRQAGYQRTIMNLVKKGFIVFAIDPIGQGERIQYFNTNGESIYGATHEHSYPGSQSFVSGVSPANYFIWDGIRAVDYLMSRKEVDHTRIGITGRSGGGTQAAYIAAMEDRILASAPECYITSFDKLLRSKGPQDAEQVLMNSLEKGFDLSDLIEIRAPKPTLLVTTTQDIFSIQGARDVFNEAQKAYRALGAPKNLNMVEDDAGHASTKKNREALYAFFQKYLNNPGDSKDEEVEVFEKEELFVTPTGQVQTFLNGETIFSLNNKYSEKLLEGVQSQRENYSEFLKRIKDKAIKLTGYVEPTKPKDYIFSGRLWRDGYSIEKYLIKGSGNYYIPLLYMIPDKITRENILLLDENGKISAAEKGKLAEQLVQSGHCVAIPDLIDIGELGGGFKRGDAIIDGVPLNVWYAGILSKKSPLSIRVEEIKIIESFMKVLNYTSGNIVGVAQGTLTSDLLHSAVINVMFKKIVLIEPLISYESIVKEKNYRTKFIMSAVPAVIGQYDLSDLAASIMPTELLFVNPVNAFGTKVDSQTFEKTYSKVIDYRRKNDAGELSFSNQDNQSGVNGKILSWINN